VLTEFGTDVLAVDSKGTFAARPIQLTPALRPSVIAFDNRRRRLMVLGRTDAGARGTPGGFYDADTGRWSPSILPVAGPPDYDSLTYSDADDCYYALGWASGAGGSVESITRIAPDGVPQWRVPVGERVTHNQRPGPAWRPQLAAAGKYLVVLTPPLPDPLDPAAPQRPRCVVIDPAANAVVYSGAMVPH
jgi:hypothetical protein